MRKNSWTAGALVAALSLPAWAASRELPPEITHATLGAAPAPAATWSKRTVAVGLEVDRDQARIVAYTLKDRPLLRGLQKQETPAPVEGEPVLLEVALLGPHDVRHTRLVDLGGSICLLHPADDEPHVEGDTIRLHRDTLVVELPELTGFDRVEVAWRQVSKGSATRRVVGTLPLAPSAFAPSGGGYRYRDLLFADASVAEPKALRVASTVQWPEQVGHPDIFRVFGDAARADERINVTIVPDGYTVAEKSLMESHAAGLVAGFRARSPYREFDAFFNYTLVYAYSAQSGTDQCDCALMADTAMGSRFPAAGDACGGAGNRCLYYGGGCDEGRTENIVAAELRAPAHDTSIVMVNTARYGGCGGTRAVYSAGHSSANEIAIHELGHTLAGLADEYGGGTGCGSWGGEVNTSTNRILGAWPEWIDDLGPPREGGRYWDRCIYRPTEACEMRSLFQPFCPVCLQRWALALLAHPRVAPTSPVRTVRPASPAVVWQGLSSSFEVETRLPAAGQSIRWYVEAPGAAEPTLVSEGRPVVEWTFAEAGNHRVSVVVTAATDLIKLERYGANVESAALDVEVLPLMAPPEVSSPTSAVQLAFTGAETIVWEDAAFAGVTAYNVYRAPLAGLATGDYGTCLVNRTPTPAATDPTTPDPGAGFAYLVTGVNPLGEGPAGFDDTGVPRVPRTPCP